MSNKTVYTAFGSHQEFVPEKKSVIPQIVAFWITAIILTILGFGFINLPAILAHFGI